MKLNFWQWLGIVLLVIGVIVWLWDRRDRNRAPIDNTATRSVG